jgi:hypothetical protein
MTDEDYDGLSTKREMVRLLAKDATGEQLDAAMHACIDSRLNDAERRTVLIEAIYGSWCERLGPPGADFAITWENVRRMFLDIHAVVGAPRPPQLASSDEKSEHQDMAPMARLSGRVPEPPPNPAPWGEKFGVAAPIGACVPSDWARARWLDRELMRSAVQYQR